jgi:hypothetical protein
MADQVLQRDIDLNGYVIKGAQGSATPASWDATVCRYYLVDYDGGDDANVGFVDAALGSTITPTGTALKTLEQLLTVIPKDGAGRNMVVLIKPRAADATYKSKDGSTDSDLNLSFLTNFRKLVVRGSTDLTNSVSDRLYVGGTIPTAGEGPNGDKSWTCAGTCN